MFKKDFVHHLLQKLGSFPAFSFALTLLILLVCVSANAQTKRLEPTDILTREIKPNQKHSYQFKIQTGQYCRITVQQQPGVDLILSLYDAKHRKLAAVGGYRGYLKTENLFPFEVWLDIISFSFIAAPSSVYEIELDAKETQIRERYQIKIDDIHPATTFDRKRVEAERLFERGERLRFPANSPNDLQLAIKNYQEALKIYREIKDVAG